MDFLLDGILAVTWQQCVMYVVGALSRRSCCRWASARSL